MIKFGTDGWRAIIADQYTVDNVARVTDATAKWMVVQGMDRVVIGFDCRFGGQMFLRTVVGVMASHGIKSIVDLNFTSTPMVSLMTTIEKAGMGIVITASHNPPSYNGFKLKSSYGGPTIPRDIKAVEDKIESSPPKGLIDFEEAQSRGLVEVKDFEKKYLERVEGNFDLEAIRSVVSLGYDAMYGAGQNVIKKLFPDSTFLHCEWNPLFGGQAPEPIARNLSLLSKTIAQNESINLGLANDGDADRIGMFDESGRFVDSHHILLLLLSYLYEYKEMTGKVVVTFSVTGKMKKLAELYGLPFEVTKIGFKYIAEIMLEEDILVAGEESGGLAVKGHIPERDGIWVGLVIMEYMAKTGKSISELIQGIYDKVGTFATDRYDLHISDDLKIQVMDRCKNGGFTEIGGQSVIRTEDIDGYKFYLSEDEWVMIRPSGTEPLLRVYCEAPDVRRVREILDLTKAEIFS